MQCTHPLHWTPASADRLAGPFRLRYPPKIPETYEPPTQEQRHSSPYSAPPTTGKKQSRIAVKSHCRRPSKTLQGRTLTVQERSFRHSRSSRRTPTNSRPRLAVHDRLFWVILRRFWSDWRPSFSGIAPDSGCIGNGSRVPTPEPAGNLHRRRCANSSFAWQWRTTLGVRRVSTAS